MWASVLYLSIDDKYQSPRSSEDHLIVKGGVKEVDLAREIPDLEVDKRAAGDVVLVDLVGALQKQGLIGRHFVKHHLKSELRSWFSGADAEGLFLVIVHCNLKLQWKQRVTRLKSN